MRHLLDEGVVGSPKDVDTCLILGAGFPFFRGGITPHLDETGVSDACHWPNVLRSWTTTAVCALR